MEERLTTTLTNPSTFKNWHAESLWRQCRATLAPFGVTLPERLTDVATAGAAMTEPEPRDTTTGMIAFVNARLDEREAAAKAAGGDEWTQPDPVRYPGRIESATDVVTYDEGCPTEGQAAHICLYDPRWVLADVAVKRRIVSLCESETWETGGKQLAMRILCGFASADSGHPDYNPAWREFR